MRFTCLLLFAGVLFACGETATNTEAMDAATVNPVAITQPDAPDLATAGMAGMKGAFKALENAVEQDNFARAKQAATALEVAYKGTETGRQPNSEPLPQTANELFRAQLTEFQLSTTIEEQRKALPGLRTALEGLQ